MPDQGVFATAVIELCVMVNDGDLTSCHIPNFLNLCTGWFLAWHACTKLQKSRSMLPSSVAARKSLLSRARHQVDRRQIVTLIIAIWH